MKGYKAFNDDMTCRGYQYEVAKTYSHDGPIKPCEAGFHFCENLYDCFNYYDFPDKPRICEVEAVGEVVVEGNKSVTNKITIIRELTWDEVLAAVNTGKDCTGYGNTGNLNTGSLNTGNLNTGSRNTGSRNTGSRNTGNLNTGYWNAGDWNTGDGNTGDWNAGYGNTGDWNAGDWNTGDGNTGDWNVCNNSAGVLCTEEHD